MLLQDEFAELLILNDQVSDVESGGGKTFSGVINGNPAALIDVQPAIAGGFFASARNGASAVAVSDARASKACARLDESDFKNYGKGHIP
jgi:hypothetical protein